MNCPLCGHPRGHIPACKLDGATTDEFVAIIRELVLERNDARAIARILAHAYLNDNQPPNHIVTQAIAYDVDQRLPKEES